MSVGPDPGAERAPQHGVAPGGPDRAAATGSHLLPHVPPHPPVRVPADVQGIDLPGGRHVSGPVVQGVRGLWLALWIIMFATGNPGIALPLMFVWIFANATYEKTVQERRKALKHAARQPLPAPPAPLRPPPPPAPPEDEGTRARRGPDHAVRRAEESAATLPAGALETVRETAGWLRPLLARAREEGVDARVAHDLHALAGEYLPRAVDDYLRLPPDVAATPGAASGRSPADDLREQLELLRQGAAQLRQAVHGADAERLATQRRFLEAKFGRSGLDL
ncbi:hypothetical protein [Kineococcus glutinatus]|uniref:hypothetical protein n=1 Tax=Kineococcus glutinatus TaxID=1070872 RepID=UPI0031ED142F